MKARLLALVLCSALAAPAPALAAFKTAPKAAVPLAPRALTPLPALAPAAALQAAPLSVPAAVAAAPQSPSAQAAVAVAEPRIFDGSSWAGRAVRAGALVLAVCAAGCTLGTDIPEVPMHDGGEYVPADVTPITWQQIYRDIDDHFYDYDRTPGEYYGTVRGSQRDAVYKVRLPEDGFLNVQVDELFGVKYDLLVVDDDGDIVLRDNNWFDISRAHEVIGDLPSGTYYVILHNNNDGALGQTYWLELYY